MIDKNGSCMEDKNLIVLEVKILATILDSIAMDILQIYASIRSLIRLFWIAVGWLFDSSQPGLDSQELITLRFNLSELFLNYLFLFMVIDHNFVRKIYLLVEV
jgi:heme O synthase-like polyprenyltransferase